MCKIYQFPSPRSSMVVNRYMYSWTINRYLSNTVTKRQYQAKIYQFVKGE